MLDRRGFLVALGLAPAAAWLASCSEAETKSLVSVDMSGSDSAIRPQDDLYRHVNGTWLREYQLPPDKTSYGAFSEAGERTQQQLREIIESISDPEDGTEAQQIRDLFDARMNLDEIERLGLTPLDSMFAEIEGAKDKPALAEVMGRLPIGGLIGIGVSIDQKNSSAYIPSIGQSGLGLDEQYYRDPQFAEELAGYRTYLERLAKGADLPDPAGIAGRLLDLETRIAAAHWDNVRNRDAEATYNVLEWDKATALAPEYDWVPWLRGITDRPQDLFAKVVVNQPSFVTEAGKIWAATDIAIWQDYLKLAVLKTYANVLPKEISDANFDFNGRLMSGLKQRPELWKSAVGSVDSNLSEQLGKLYVDKHFPPEAKERVQAMVDDLMSAYRENFTNSTWMSPETRNASIEKLDKIGAKLGYPDKWVDYSGLKVTRGKLIESLRAVNDFEVKRSFDRLGKPVDKAEWSASPQTVNAYYSATNNEIVFPAAFLQPPFFDKDAELAVNYGGVGAVIGHEIGHGFDDQGSKFDGDGNQRDWWTPADRDAFDAKSQQLIEQYNALVPEGLSPEQHVNGALTVGENLADLRGLQIALAAYRIAAQRQGVTNPDFHTMFNSYARIWRSKSTPEVTERLLAGDTHSPDEFRVNQVVRNIAEFYRTFGVVESDKLFLSEDQRIEL
ncbi:M13 family metallopeptidase [Nocardia jinanensis]|uniref:Peptidase M13 n=1 Tax=Nocardia jinanensis TaxID=382504 RepID=A0A917VWU3_9NOCA|nr:M13 family metallopeptidase [Nocardia jinanensis]GGL23416.1 peptidase M13 [Nocardia jinanensis]